MYARNFFPEGITCQNVMPVMIPSCPLNSVNRMCLETEHNQAIRRFFFDTGGHRSEGNRGNRDSRGLHAL